MSEVPSNGDDKATPKSGPIVIVIGACRFIDTLWSDQLDPGIHGTGAAAEIRMPGTETLRLDDLRARAAGGVGGGETETRVFAHTLGCRVELSVTVEQRPVVGFKPYDRDGFGDYGVGAIVVGIRHAIVIGVEQHAGDDPNKRSNVVVGKSIATTSRNRVRLVKREC